MYCSKCGTQIQDNSVACSSCGASMAALNPIALATDKVKAACTDALQAFKMFASNPVVGLSVAFENLGPARALGVGIVFGTLFALCIVFGVYRLLPEWGRPNGFSGFLKILVVAFVPVISLFGAGVFSRKVFRGKGGFGHDSFITGAALLPFGFFAMLVGILGIGNTEVIAVFTLFAVCLSILMLFAGLTRICKTSEQSATIAVPSMLLVSAWLSKIIYTTMLR